MPIDLTRLDENNFVWVCDQNGVSYYDLINALTKEEVKLVQESCRNYPILLDGITEIEETAKAHGYGVKSDQVLSDINQIIIKLALAVNGNIPTIKTVNLKRLEVFSDYELWLIRYALGEVRAYNEEGVKNTSKNLWEEICEETDKRKQQNPPSNEQQVNKN